MRVGQGNTEGYAFIEIRESSVGEVRAEGTESVLPEARVCDRNKAVSVDAGRPENVAADIFKLFLRSDCHEH